MLADNRRHFNESMQNVVHLLDLEAHSKCGYIERSFCVDMALSKLRHRRRSVQRTELVFFIGEVTNQNQCSK
jgi:hypothetical protein